MEEARFTPPPSVKHAMTWSPIGRGLWTCFLPLGVQKHCKWQQQRNHQNRRPYGQYDTISSNEDRTIPGDRKQNNRMINQNTHWRHKIQQNHQWPLLCCKRPCKRIQTKPCAPTSNHKLTKNYYRMCLSTQLLFDSNTCAGKERTTSNNLTRPCINPTYFKPSNLQKQAQNHFFFQKHALCERKKPSPPLLHRRPPRRRPRAEDSATRRVPSREAVAHLQKETVFVGLLGSFAW